MSVLDRFPSRPPQDIVLRGLALFQQGRTDAYTGNSTRSVEGKVFDQGVSFDTLLTWENGQPLTGYCHCAEFVRHKVCRHVVATALKAEEEEYFSMPQSATPERETRPRGQRGVTWISPDGRIRRLDQEDEPRPVVNHKPQPPSWKKQFEKLRKLAKEETRTQLPFGFEPWPQDRQILYIIDAQSCAECDCLLIDLAVRDRRSGGEWSRPKTRGVQLPPVELLSDPADQQIISLLLSTDESFVSSDLCFETPPALHRNLIRLMCQTGRAMMRVTHEDEPAPISWDTGPAWEFWLEGVTDETAHAHVLSGWLRRNGSEKIPVSRPLWISDGGVVLFPNAASELESGAPSPWIKLLRSQRAINVPVAQSGELLGELMELGQLPHLDLPESLRVEQIAATPAPRLRVRAPSSASLSPSRLHAELSFDYAGLVVKRAFETPRHAFDAAQRRIFNRDPDAEARFAAQLTQLGMRELPGDHGGTDFQFHHRHLPRIIRTLIQKNWHVEAEGKLYRQPGKLRLNVSSGIDWFELRGEIDFDGKTVRLPELLAALRRGDNTVTLGDGTVGMLPESWLKRFGLLAAMGGDEAEFIKFSKTQVGLLDALLAEQGDATCDETFTRIRDQLHRFSGIVPQDPVQSFRGELRPYQRDGLGWFSFLRQFGFGGCLADDMGLGKTVQVLALLAGRVQEPNAGSQNSSSLNPEPSLVVVPRSLVFNWKQEAARFAPHLRVLDHTGIDRGRTAGHLKDHDIILTTYGTLRRDAAFLKDVAFDYVILDEAQAVKNPASESAKAVRLVKGRHRLALSGTPVQNHLGDLWSLFDFLNPGMLGAASIFGDSSSLKNPEPETRELLARALRPFILRRTKEQVASDLPPKLEQTIYCELDAPQRKLYDELKEYYRRSLLERVDREGMGKNKMQILEALLRLRQAALHPGLIDDKRADEPSAKLDVLLPQLAEVIDEGHKALVFSQFTSMLALVRRQLDREKIPYEYLDGQTRDREERVKHFQEDDTCKLFLISLKAGGLGLNLTAADYVFLLDPWWNPAIEAQAIDRTHRIGQTRHVYACRLIARDTVEEKVVALQKTKRDLADAIIGADNSVIRDLGRDDLELLLS